MMNELGEHFEFKVDIPLIRHGKRQRIETLINEEALLLAKYLRGEKKHGVQGFYSRSRKSSALVV
jgi:hypothetical protein